MCLRCLRRRRPEALYLLLSELSASHVPLCKLYQVDSVPEYLLPMPVPLYQCTCANSCHSFQTPPPSSSLPPLPLPPQFLLHPFLREFMNICYGQQRGVMALVFFDLIHLLIQKKRVVL